MSEAKEQAEIFKWFCRIYPQYKQSWSTSMNGINLPGTPRQIAIIINHMKSQGGMRAGEADFKILLPRGGFHGLVVEHKAEDGKHKLTQEQDEYLQYMGSKGYMSVYCKGIASAKETIEAYMYE